jgi:hypothetical protein
MMSWRRTTLLIAMLVAVLLCITVGSASAAELGATICSSGNNDPHNPANPLDSANHVGSDPLNGAHLFVESPWLLGGDAANAIADQIGLGWLAHNYGQLGAPIPWATFRALADSLLLPPSVRERVSALEKIASGPFPHQFSYYTQGGSPAAVYSHVQYYLCRMQRTDPGATGVFTTYFLNHSGQCYPGTVTPSQRALFKGEVDSVRRAVGSFSALIFIEEDAVDTAGCLSRQGLRDREQLLRYEIGQLSKLPHALLYVEGGTADAQPARFAAKMLSAAGARRIRGFFLGDTHFNWASSEIAYGNKVSRMTHGLHFVVDTRADGNGPLKTADPVHQGNEVLCNPPGRALGPPPGSTDGRYSKHLDGFVWVTIPGESAATHCPGSSQTFAPSGIFDENYAIGLAESANNRVGPGYPSQPY